MEGFCDIGADSHEGGHVLEWVVADALHSAGKGDGCQRVLHVHKGPVAQVFHTLRDYQVGDFFAVLVKMSGKIERIVRVNSITF